MTRKKEKKIKKKRCFSKGEIVFNFISIVAVFSIGLYYGTRAMYYYSLQNINKKETENTLNSLLDINNMIIKEGEGLHQDEEGKYFKGVNVNNYVRFANRTFRIIRVNNDETISMVSQDLVASLIWGEDKSYANSNIKLWLTNDSTDSETSGVYFKTLPNPVSFLAKTEYTEDTLEDNKVIEGKDKYSDYVTTLGINDYITAGGKNSYLNIKKLFYLLGYNKEGENLYIEEDGSVLNCDTLDGYGIRSVITFNKNLVVEQGNGSSTDPYVIKQGENTNYIDGYVKLGNDTWKIINDKNGVLKMHLNGYISDGNGGVYTRNYGKYNSIFDLEDRYNIASYLNNDYLGSLPYNNIIVDNVYYNGEFSADSGYHFKDNYSNYIYCKVALLNIFDYVSNNELDDYFHMNTTSNVGSLQYSRRSNGLLEEADISEEKHIVPVISISSKSIKKGTGTIDDPYVVE